MKRLGNLWSEVVAFENLWLAWRQARRGKAGSAQVGRFELELEANLLDLQRELQDGSYRPGDYRLFTIYERKSRLIARRPGVAVFTDAASVAAGDHAPASRPPRDGGAE